jgi:transposase InsO family protein
MRGEHPVRLLCQVLGVAASGYYRLRTQPRSARAIEDERLAEHIVQAHRDSRQTYGAPRIVSELQAAGVRISRRRCARLMRAQGIRGRKKHRRCPRTTNSSHGRPTPGNRLAERSAPSGPNQIWVTDITYLQTSEGWLYLAAILDLWSRRVVGWACAPTLHASVTIAALRHGLRARRPSRGLMHHSDRGSQYVDDQYVEILEAHGIERSMSRVANCYDNAFIESFWSTLKSDTGLDTTTPASRAEAELAVFDYIETFYNPTRRHSSLGNLSPVAFEKTN